MHGNPDGESSQINGRITASSRCKALRHVNLTNPFRTRCCTQFVVIVNEQNLICYRPQVWGKVMYLHPCVILFTGGEHPQADIPLGRPLTRADTPLGRHTPRQTSPKQTPPGRHPPPLRRQPKRAVGILLECIIIRKI